MSPAQAAELKPGRKPSGDARIRSLDGLRGVALVLVVMTHLTGTPGSPVPEWFTHWELGMTSVRSFFVLSAFLITEILLRQHARPEGIQLGRFYFRRSMRVFPPYIALLAGVALADHLGWFKLRPHDFLHAATYTMNLFDVPVPAPDYARAAVREMGTVLSLLACQAVERAPV